MKCSEIAARLEKLNPEFDVLEIARLCSLIANAVDDSSTLQKNEYFMEVWTEVNLRLNAASDQHSAITAELKELSQSDPQKFTPEQIWILVRAIKVQSQILRLYVGDPEFLLS